MLLFLPFSRKSQHNERRLQHQAPSNMSDEERSVQKPADSDEDDHRVKEEVEEEREKSRDHQDDKDDESVHKRDRGETERDYDDRDRDRGGDRGGDRSRTRRGGGEQMSTSLLVRNLSFHVRTDELKRLFNKYGEVRDVYIPEVSCK